MGLFNPKNFVEGGLRTVNAELTWKDCKFGLFTYTKKDGTPTLNQKTGQPLQTVAALITYGLPGDDEDVVQAYSIGDPGRYEVSKDGKKLVSDTPVTKGCNFALLMENLLNAGLPENKLEDLEDISTLNGMVTYNIGIPEPKRQGLAPRTDENGRERIISVPSEIRKLPWEKKASGKKPATKAAAKDEGADQQFIDFVAGQVESGGESTKQELAQAVFSNPEYAKSASDIASKLFAPEGVTLLTENGFTVDGDTISKE